MSELFPTLVAEVFLDDRDVHLLSVIEALAPRAGVARVHLVYVVEAGRAWPGRAVVPPARPEALDPLEARLAEALPACVVVGDHRAGRSIDEIARLAGEVSADLLLVGRSDRPGGDGWAEHGQRLLRLADCSVLVVPEGAPARFERAAVGMDFSPHAREAVAIAHRIADRVEVIAVVDPVDERADAEVIAASRVAWRAAYPADVEPPPLAVVPGRTPAEALASVPGVDILVCGSRGLTPLAAVLLGSTAERLGARCAGLLLVVRRRGEHRGLFRTLFRAE